METPRITARRARPLILTEDACPGVLGQQEVRRCQTTSLQYVEATKSVRPVASSRPPVDQTCRYPKRVLVRSSGSRNSNPPPVEEIDACGHITIRLR